MRPLEITKYLDINPEKYYARLNVESIAMIIFNTWHTIALECPPILAGIQQTEYIPKPTSVNGSQQ